MSVIAKRLVNDYEEGILEFLQTCVDENYKIYTQVSLIQICEPDSILDSELRKFLFSSSTVDILITDSNYMPCLAVESQSGYHDSPKAIERDQKKANILKLAGVPLIYTRVRRCRFLHLSCSDKEVVFNLYTGQGQEEAKALIKTYCKQLTNSEVQLAAW
ncbi:MAG: DUF2726 domain-containing protein [Coleofasciculaceae cyanobacterium]